MARNCKLYTANGNFGRHGFFSGVDEVICGWHGRHSPINVSQRLPAFNSILGRSLYWTHCLCWPVDEAIIWL